MIIDSHTHLFPPAVISNVAAKEDLVRLLRLESDRAASRTTTEALRREAGDAGVAACVLLPTAARDSVGKVNRLFRQACRMEDGGGPRLFTLGTLHPRQEGLETELDGLASAGIRGIKLCSFSQGFDLLADETLRMFSLIEARNRAGRGPFFVILDTFGQADRFFGAPAEHLTTPERLGRLVRTFPGINFVGAHMAGLASPFEEVLEYLPPSGNLFLETSNAAHTLDPEQFVRLLRLHGPERILFGTDWPWFGQRDELRLLRKLAGAAGFDPPGMRAILGGNAARLLGIPAGEVQARSPGTVHREDPDVE